jgi:hypothetical protein
MHRKKIQYLDIIANKYPIWMTLAQMKQYFL